MDNLVAFPDQFLAFLKSHSGDEAYEFDDIEWWIATKAELTETVNIDGVEYPYFSQLAGYAKAIASATGAESTEDADGQDYPFSRLAAGLAFATGDGDVLYFDPADEFSVWQFEHDGGGVDRVADNFTDWLESGGDR